MLLDLFPTSFLLFLAASILPVVHSYDFTNIPLNAVHTAQQPFEQSIDSNKSASTSTTTAAAADSVLYNVSSLGLPDPFSHYSTRLTYDTKVELSDHHNNQKGSILSLLNGTIYPLGSVGAIGAVGWEGNSNDTDVTSAGDRTTTAQDTKKGGDDGSSSGGGRGGMSGIWLAFTASDALTGGYTLNNDTLTTSNNLVYHNLTFLSNFTMHQDGTYTFKFSMAALPAGEESGQFESPRCTEGSDKKHNSDFSMTCTGARKR